MLSSLRYGLRFSTPECQTTPTQICPSSHIVPPSPHLSNHILCAPVCLVFTTASTFAKNLRGGLAFGTREAQPVSDFRSAAMSNSLELVCGVSGSPDWESASWVRSVGYDYLLFEFTQQSRYTDMEKVKEVYRPVLWLSVPDPRSDGEIRDVDYVSTAYCDPVARAQELEYPYEGGEQFHGTAPCPRTDIPAPVRARLRPSRARTGAGIRGQGAVPAIGLVSHLRRVVPRHVLGFDCFLGGPLAKHVMNYFDLYVVSPGTSAGLQVVHHELCAGHSCAIVWCSSDLSFLHAIGGNRSIINSPGRLDPPGPAFSTDVDN